MKEKSQAYAVVNYLVNRKGVGKERVARAAGVSLRMIDYTLALGDKRKLGSSALSRLAENLGLSEGGLVAAALADNGDGAPGYDEIVFVRKMKAHPRGGEGGHETGGGYSERYAFRRDWIKTKAPSLETLRLFDVVGQSMAPTINDGDMVMVDEARNDEWMPGRIYVVTLNDAFMIKRASMKPGLLILQSDNADKATHPDIEIAVDSPEYFHVHGRVIWSCREY